MNIKLGRKTYRLVEDILRNLVVGILAADILVVGILVDIPVDIPVEDIHCYLLHMKIPENQFVLRSLSASFERHQTHLPFLPSTQKIYQSIYLKTHRGLLISAVEVVVIDKIVVIGRKTEVRVDMVMSLNHDLVVGFQACMMPVATTDV
jgi:hypothetical protein